VEWIHAVDSNNKVVAVVKADREEVEWMVNQEAIWEAATPHLARI
jgi:hypothetical protein